MDDRPARSHPRLAFAVALTAAYLAATALLALRHEIWRDEGQAWLLARDAPSISHLLGQMGYEGSPGLWHLTLRPLARTGLPVASMLALNVALATAAIALLAFAAPFRPWETALIAFGWFPFAWYGVVARSYTLSMLLLFLAATLHPARRDRPWLYAAVLALLANTNVHSTLFAAALGLVLAYERLREGEGPLGRRAAPLLPWIVGLALAVLQVLPPDDLAPHLRAWRRLDPLAEWRQFLPVLGALLLLASPRAALVYGLGSTAVVLVFITKYGGLPWHRGTVYLLFVACAWIAERERPRANWRPRWLACAWSAALLWVLLRWFVPSIDAVRAHWSRPYSAGRAVARLLAEDDPEGRSLLVVYPSFLGASILPYRPAQRATAHYLEYGAPRSYTTWNRQLAESRGPGWSVAEVARRAREAASVEGRPAALLVLGYPDCFPSPENTGRPELPDAERLGDFPGAVAVNESMVVYRLPAQGP